MSDYKGLEVENPKIELINEDFVGSVNLVHVGKIGGIKINISGHAKFFPILEKAVDKLEEMIPGDQKAIAEMLKSALKSIKIKF